MTEAIKISGDVGRFNYVGDDAEMVAEPDGEFVYYSDYEQLQSRLAQVEKERDEARDTLRQKRRELIHLRGKCRQ